MNQKCALLFARIHDWTQTDAPEAEPTAVWEAGGVKQVNRGNLIATARPWQGWHGHGKGWSVDIPYNSLC